VYPAVSCREMECREQQMNDSDKTKEQLLAELRELRARVGDAASSEEALHESERRISHIVHAAPLGIHECDTEGRITFVNPFQEKITGYSAGELVGTYIWDRMEPGPAKDASPAYLKQLVLEQPSPTPYFNRNIRKNGEIFDVRIDWNYKRDSQGRLTGFVSIVSDITKQKQAEKELRESEERYRKLAESTTDIVYILDEAGGLLYANRSAAACIGIPQVDLVGKKQDDLFRLDMAKFHVERIRRVFETGEAVENDEPFNFGYGEIWLNIHLIPLRDEQNKVVAVMGVCRNITDRKRMEQELVKSRTMLQAAIDCLPFDFWAIGPDGHYVMENAVSKTLWGKFIGKRPEEVCPNKEDLEIWQENNRRAFAGERVEGEVCFTIKGKTRFCHNILTPIRSGDLTYGILGVNIDITERKLAEEALRKARDELEQRVKERTAELVKTNEQLAIFRRFAESSDQGFGIADLNCNITYMNPALCRLLGEERAEDFVGKSFFNYITKESRQKHENEFIPALIQEGRRISEGNMLSRQGTVIPILLNSFLIPDDEGKPAYLATVITDFSELKRAEEALRQSHDELQAIYDKLLDGLLVADMETQKFLRANSSMCRMLGYSEQELLQLSVKDIHPPKDLEDVLKMFKTHIEHAGSYHNEVPFMRKDGSVFFAEVRDSHVLYNGRPCLLGFMRDITERKRAREALQQEHRALRHLLQSSDHERQVISYDIHDGLAQYIAGAILQFQTYTHLQVSNPAQAAKCFDTGMTLLQKGHSESRRLISGVRPPILDESGITAAIAHMVHDHSFDQGPRIEFRSRVKFGRLAPILENAIYRIIQEGVSNACRHSESDKVRISLMQQDAKLKIEIRDWGVGFRLDEVGGERFGLEGIRQRARLLGGQVDIESVLNKGTRITVELPLIFNE
jgi:PAS domain S-box-containing protein